MLRPGLFALALKLQEAAGDLSNNDVVTRLRDALNDAFKGSSNYAYYIDHFGDSASGDLIYCLNGDTFSAPYEISQIAGGAAVCTIDTDNAVDVVPRTVYEQEADEADHYAAMEESFKKAKLYTALPLYERFISKSQRDAMDAADFAGKNKSFPIKTEADVMAAFHSLGRAGSDNYSTSVIRANIIKIAKRKGFKLPKSAQDDKAKEAAPAISSATTSAGLRLVESAMSIENIVIKEAKADYEIKLIAPGKGSSAFYPAEVLRRDGPNVFKQGTHVYLNHATMAEEAQRPEGDVRNLAGVLTSTAEYHESHAKGPGLYARMKVFADHAQLVEDKAPHVGMSIRASGVAESNKTKYGVPVLKELTSAESVDVVTRAGAGGMILTESAAPAAQPQQEVSDMDAAELKTLQESLKTTQAVNAQLLERALKSDAREYITELLEAVTLPAAAKKRIVNRVIETVPTKDGALDTAKLKESLDAAAKAEGQYLAEITGAGRVVGMGQAPTEIVDPKESERRIQEQKDEDAQGVQVFESLGMPKEAALFAVKGRAA